LQTRDRPDDSPGDFTGDMLSPSDLKAENEALRTTIAIMQGCLLIFHPEGYSDSQLNHFDHFNFK